MEQRNVKIGIDLDVNKASVNEVRKALQDFQKYINQINENNGLDTQLKQAAIDGQKLNRILNEAWNSKLNQLDLSQLSNSINKTYGSVEKLKIALEKAGTIGGDVFNTFSRAVLNTNLQLSQSSKLLDDMADTMTKTVKWGIASSVFNRMTSSVQKAFNYTKQLDTSLNDIRIVTGKSADEMDRFAKRANQVSKDLGRSTKDFTEASLIYYQQGLGNEEAQARAEVTMKAANVTGQTGQEVSEQLTAVWNGYKVSAEETELYVDKLAAVAAGTAADLEELSTGMSKVASAANVMGVDVDQLNAQLATIVSVTRQAPESVGVALKTIYSRMADIKSGLDDETTLGNYTGKMAQYGINVLDANNNLRDMGDIIEEVGGKWNSLSKEQQVALSQVMAGTRQYNNLLSLFDNWDMYKNALEMSANAAGTLQKQQDIYMESTAAHLKQLSTEAEETYDILFDQDTVNGFTDALTNTLDIFNKFLKGIGGGTHDFIYFGSLVSNIFKKQIAEGINNTIDRIEKMKENMASLKLMREATKEGTSLEANKERPAYVENDIERAEELLNIQKYISNEDFNDLNSLRQKVTEYDAIIEKIEKINTEYSNLTFKEADKNYKEVDLRYQKQITSKNKILELTEKINASEKKTGKDFNLNKKDLQEELELLKNNLIVQDDIKDIETIEKTLKKEKQLSQEQINKITELEEKTILKINNERIEQLAIAKAIEAVEKGTANDLQEEYNRLKQIYSERIDFNTRKGQLSDLVQGLSAISMLLTSISGIIKTINDEDLTTGEKIEQVTTVLLANLPMLIMNLEGLTKLLPAIAGLTNRAAIAMGAEGVTAASSFGASLAGIISVAGPYVLAIGAIVGAIGGLIYASQAEQREIDKLRKSSEELKKEAEETKNSLDDLKNSFNGYKTAIEALEKCKKGTEEWNSSLENVNQTIIDILEKYPELAKIEGFIQRDEQTGQLSINEALLRDHQRQLEKEYVQQKIGSLNLANQASQKEYERDYNKILNRINTELQNPPQRNVRFTQGDSFQNRGTLSYDTSSRQNATLSEKQFEALFKIANVEQLFNEKIQEYANEMVNAGKITKETSQSWVNSMKDNRQAILELSNTQKQVNTELKSTAQIAATTALGSNSSNVAQRLFKERYIENAYSYGKNTKGLIQSSMKGLSPDVAFVSGDDDKILARVSKAGDINKELADKILSDTFTVSKISQKEYEQILSKKDEIIKALKDTGVEGAESFAESFKTAMEQDWNAEEYAENLKEQFSSALSAAGRIASEAFDLDEDEFKEFGQYLADIADESEKLADTMDEDADATAVVTQSILRMNRGIESLAEGWEEWVDILSKSSKESQEYWEALDKTQDALLDLLDASKDVKKYLDDDFIKQNAEDIAEAASGNAEAIDKLRQAALEQIVLKIKLDDSELNNEQLWEKVQGLQSMLDSIDMNIDIGTNIQNESFIQACNEMIEQAHLTKEQANAIFEQMGFQAQFATEEQPTSYSVPIYTTYVRSHKTRDEDTGLKETGWEPQQETMTVQTGTETLTGEYATFAMSTTTPDGGGGIPKITGMVKKATGSMNNYSSSNKGGGSPGKTGKSGGSGKSKEPDTMDPLEKESDRYHDIDIQLKQIQTDLDKLDKQKKKLFGQDLINNLNKRLGLLNKQIDATNEKIKIAQGETQELRDKLVNKGVSFNADGTIANYAQVYASQLNYVNGLINQYNAMGAEAQESFKDTVEQAKEDFDKFVSNIDRYDKLITDMIPGLEADIQSAVDEKIDLQIEKFDMEIELRLNMAEAERDWNEFKKKIIDDIKDDNILGNAMARLVDFSSYYKEDNTGIVQALRKQVDNTLAELNQMDTNGWSNVYGDNRTAALDDLQKYYKELMTNLQDVLDLQEEIHKSYIDMMNEAQEKFDEQIKSYEMISDLIEHDMQVISLVYGEKSYNQLTEYYNKQQQNFNSQLDFQRQQLDFWRQQLDTLEEGSDAWDNAKEKWMSAVKEWNDLVEKSIENLQDKYLNAINLIFQNLNNKVTDGLGLDYIEEEWNLINKNADQYLDTINSLYEVQKLENKYLDALDKTDNIAAQRQLKKIMDEELADLRERDKLTEYDIERANKKYEIALKQIALQEAQQNKTKMRLRRDSQGNYRYEYTADQDQIGALQDELNDMYNSLYNFDKARYQDNLNQLYSVWVEFQEKMAEAAQINDPVARSERELLLQNQYEQLINGLTEQNATVRENLHESAFDDLSRLYDVNVSNFQNMSDEEKDVLMSDLLPYWESGVQHMTDVFAGEGGFLGVCKDAFEQLHEATRDYEDDLDELEVAGRIDFDSIGEAIDENIDRTQQLITDNTDLINSYEQELTAIGNVIGELDNLVTKYNEAKDAAIAATKAAYEYWSEQQRQAAAAAGNASQGSGNSGAGSNSSGSSGASGGAGSGQGDGNLIVGETATFSGKYYYDSYGTSPVGSKYSGVANGIVVDRITNNPFGIHIHSADGKYPDLGWIKKSQLSGYDTGGYTGSWGADGKLALLHEKELVLNKEDTKNILDAISIMRNITGILGNSILGKIAAATAGSLDGSIGNDTLEQNVHIDAQFPNVKDSREIEEALNNLVNMASMRANKR